MQKYPLKNHVKFFVKPYEKSFNVRKPKNIGIDHDQR